MLTLSIAYDHRFGRFMQPPSQFTRGLKERLGKFDPRTQDSDSDQDSTSNLNPNPHPPEALGHRELRSRSDGADYTVPVRSSTMNGY
jgi:hypothetical protein